MQGFSEYWIFNRNILSNKIVFGSKEQEKGFLRFLVNHEDDASRSAHRGCIYFYEAACQW